MILLYCYHRNAMTNSYTTDLDMRGINVAIRIRPGRRDAHSVVVVRDNVDETILLTIAFQCGDHAVTLQSLLGNLLKLGKQLAFELALQCLQLSADKRHLLLTRLQFPIAVRTIVGNTCITVFSAIFQVNQG